MCLSPGDVVVPVGEGMLVALHPVHYATGLRSASISGSSHSPCSLVQFNTQTEASS